MTVENKTEESNSGTIGQRFRAARQARQVTPSEVAAATNMLEKHVKALEEDDFASMGAVIYTKGFIKLYAEYLNMPVQPLVDEYVRKYARKTGSQPHVSTGGPVPSTTPKAHPEVGKKLQEGVNSALAAARKIPKPVLKMWLINGAIAIALILLIVGIIFGIKGCVNMAKERQAEDQFIESAGDAVIEEPPEPYLNTEQ